MPEEEDEYKGGDCPLRPQFDQGKDDDKKVRLTTSKYVQLLIDARETDPACWPPGLEEAARMIERARTIEDECIEKWGDFDPAKLSAKAGREYLEIQLALDTLQEEAGEDEVSLQAARDEARESLDEEEGRSETPPPEPPAPPSGGFDLPSPSAPPGSGFFAAPRAAPADLSLALSLGLANSVEEEEAAPVILVADGWAEMPPLQRPDNYA